MQCEPGAAGRVHSQTGVKREAFAPAPARPDGRHGLRQEPRACASRRPACAAAAALVMRRVIQEGVQAALKAVGIQVCAPPQRQQRRALRGAHPAKPGVHHPCRGTVGARIAGQRGPGVRWAAHKPLVDEPLRFGPASLALAAGPGWPPALGPGLPPLHTLAGTARRAHAARLRPHRAGW